MWGDKASRILELAIVAVWALYWTKARGGDEQTRGVSKFEVWRSRDVRDE